MWEFLQALRHHPDFWLYMSIPLWAGCIGWLTNKLAIQVTFYPVDFIGVPPFLGWQGIIPRKGRKMATILVDNTLGKITSTREIFQEFEPHKIAMHIVKVVDARIEEFTDDIINEQHAVLWENLPDLIKSRVYARTRKQLPQMMDDLLEEIQENIEELVDPREMIVEQMSTDKLLLNRVFLACADAELGFLHRAGFVIGLLIGLAAMVAWWFFPHWWVLPLAGFVIAFATNLLALNLVFRPLSPIKIGPFTVQGLFLKRQKAVSEIFCRMITSEVLTVGHFMRAIFRGAKSERTKAMIKKHLRPIVDNGMVKTMAQITVGAEGYVDLKHTIEEKTIEMSLSSFDDPVFTRERGVMVEKMFRDRMQDMSAEGFQNLLRPAFQEDQLIVICGAGVLGAITGLLELALFLNA